MGITGIICEFNPFHNGHQHLIEKARELFPENSIALIMSGNVVQRGELALFDKSLRAKWAIKSGADIVFELPAVFSCAYATFFASGAVFLLSQLPQITNLVFGSEFANDDTLEALNAVSSIVRAGGAKFKGNLEGFLRLGQSYPRALSNSICKINEDEQTDKMNICLFPNNILGMEYLFAIEQFNSQLVPHAIPRLIEPETILSASELRTIIAQSKGEYCELKPFVPKFVFEDLSFHRRANESAEVLFCLVKAKLLAGHCDLKNVSEVTEGIENRFVKAIEKAISYEQYIHAIKSKRYTMAKIKRILISILIDKSKTVDKNAFENIDYIKVLAIKLCRKDLLSMENKLNFITKSADFDKLSEKSQHILRIDKNADDLFNVCSSNPTTTLLTHKMQVIE